MLQGSMIGEELVRENLDKKASQFHNCVLVHLKKIERYGLKRRIPKEREKLRYLKVDGDLESEVSFF